MRVPGCANSLHGIPSGVFDYVEEAFPGIQGLSFVDDVAWWAEGKSDSAGLGRSQRGNHVSVQATEETHGVGTSRGARSPLQSTRHAVAS